MMYKPTEDELAAALHDFLSSNAMSAADVDVVINGASGDMTHDQYVNRMVDTNFQPGCRTQV